MTEKQAFQSIRVAHAQALSKLIQKHEPTFYFSSRTSTVIPYDRLASSLKSEKTLCDMTALPAELALTNDGDLHVRGAVTWQEARSFCQAHGRSLKTSPTEELAMVLAGLATSATGERSFGYGPLRDQVKELEYLNYQGEVRKLFFETPLSGIQGLDRYQQEYRPYCQFKNGPFPRMQQETDLMVGTEGQLGIITQATLATEPLENLLFLFILLPRWEEATAKHEELFQKIQNFRGSILAAELIDSHGFGRLPKELHLGKKQDVVFLEVKESAFEKVFENLLSEMPEVYEIPAAKYHQLRAALPRAVAEFISQKGLVKKGTDVQVAPVDLKKLFQFYTEAQKLNIPYTLFGHFGDAHLHFNFLPTADQVERCQEFLLELYEKVYAWKGSPFAEHGIGIIKQHFIRKFYGETQRRFFQELKKQHDPYNQFFPSGYMSL